MLFFLRIFGHKSSIFRKWKNSKYAEMQNDPEMRNVFSCLILLSSLEVSCGCELTLSEVDRAVLNLTIYAYLISEWLTNPS